MPRRSLAVTALLLLAACASEPPAPQQAARTIPAPPPMPSPEIPAGGQVADLGTAHVSACTIAVFSEVPQRIEGVERIQADDASLTEFPAEDGSVRVVGSGRYYRPASEWSPFRFACVYDTAEARITSFEVTSL